MVGAERERAVQAAFFHCKQTWSGKNRFFGGLFERHLICRNWHSCVWKRKNHNHTGILSSIIMSPWMLLSVGIWLSVVNLFTRPSPSSHRPSQPSIGCFCCLLSFLWLLAGRLSFAWKAQEGFVLMWYSTTMPGKDNHSSTLGVA